MSELIIIEKDTLLLRSLPLESYLIKNQIDFQKLLAERNFTVSTGCYRQYQGLWKLQNDSLFLIRIKDCNENKNLDLNAIFSDLTNHKIYAEWFSDTLLTAFGKQIHSEHWGWGSYYEKEKEFILTNGIVQKTIEYDNSKSHVSKYDNNGKLLQEFLLSKINWDVIPKLDRQKRVIVSFEPDEKSVDVSILSSDDKRLNDEALKVVKQIDDWTRIYSRGKLIRSGLSIPIIFKETNRPQ